MSELKESLYTVSGWPGILMWFYDLIHIVQLRPVSSLCSPEQLLSTVPIIQTAERYKVKKAPKTTLFNRHL